MVGGGRWLVACNCVLASITRTADQPGPRPFSRRHAFRSPGAHGLPGRVPAAQGAIRSVGDGAPRAAAVSRRTRARPGWRTRPARSGDAAAGRSSPNALVIDRDVARVEREGSRRARRSVATAVGARCVCRQRDRRHRYTRHRHRRVEPCVRRAHRSGSGRAAAARARVAVLPCCHDLDSGDAGELSGWVDGSLAIDLMRAMRLAQHGYRIWTQAIPAGITPKNRLLLGAPLGGRW